MYRLNKLLFDMISKFKVEITKHKIAIVVSGIVLLSILAYISRRGSKSLKSNKFLTFSSTSQEKMTKDNIKKRET